MSDEHDSWFKDAFGVDLGAALNQAEAGASAALGAVGSAVAGAAGVLAGAAQGMVGGVVGAVAGAASGALGAAGSAAAGLLGGGGTGSFPLSGSVGRGGKNAPGDVKAVQGALGIGVDGQCGPQTIAAIEAFQRNTMGVARPDGRVDAGGATERALRGGGKAAAAPAPGPAAAPDGGDDGGLLGKALKGAGDLAGGLVDLGAQVVKGIEEAVDNGALANQLKSPSYVNNPDTPPALEGGGTASAGDSFFVTGQQKSQLTGQIQNIYAAADAINKIATDLEKKGTSKYWFDDTQMLQSAKNLHATASAMIKLGKALDRGDPNKEALEKGSKALEYVDKAIKAAEAVGALRGLSLATENLEKKTDEASVNAWADSVGDAFDKAGALIDLIPKGAIPGFAVDYYKGLFSAPKNYIAAFKTMMKVHYGSIDKEAGISGGKSKAEDLGKTGLDWEGDLSGMFVQAYFQPKSRAGDELQRFMLRHRKSEGVDLFNVTLQVGKAVLTSAVETHFPPPKPGEEDDPAKDAWIAFFANYR